MVKLITFNFTKINAEKLNPFTKDAKINSSISIDSIEESKETSKLKSVFLIVKWKYNIEYSPKIANFSFEGNLIVNLDEKQAKETLKEWKNKKLNSELNTSLINLIMTKCSIKSVSLEDEFNLPTHFKFPSLKIKENN